MRCLINQPRLVYQPHFQSHGKPEQEQEVSRLHKEKRMPEVYGKGERVPSHISDGSDILSG